MARTASDVLIDTPQDWDVEVVFGLPGDGINGIMESLRQRQDQIRFIQVRQRNENRKFLEQAQAGMREWWDLMETRGTRDDKPMKPQVVAWELGKRLAGDAIVSSDSGTIATWFARQIKARRGQMFSLSGTLASMANGLPYTIAAQVAYPGRQCVAFVGDGAFTMLMGELATAVKYQPPSKW